MKWSFERRRFAGAIALFLVWVTVLGTLTVISSYLPAHRKGKAEPPAATIAPQDEVAP